MPKMIWEDNEPKLIIGDSEEDSDWIKSGGARERDLEAHKTAKRMHDEKEEGKSEA